MKVTRTGEARPAGSVRRAERKQGGGTFSEHLDEGGSAAVAGGALATGVTGPGESLLSVQEVPDPGSERSRGRAKAYAEDLLDRLEAVRVGILVGSIPKEKLMVLAQRLRAQRQRCDDPRLNDIIEEVELRVEVEIAKLTR